MKIINVVQKNKVRIIFALLVAAILGIDARREATSLAETLITNQLLGIAVSLVVASCYGFRNLRKPYYILVSLLGILGTALGGWYWLGHQTVGYVGYFIMIPLNVWFLLLSWGLMIEHVFLKKDAEFRLAKWEIAVILAAIGMTLSVNEAFWPLYDLLLMIPLWHAPYSREEKTGALEGLMDGVILGFFLIQSFAYYNRPYDEVRYLGTWYGSNMNALFYLETLAAIAGKFFLSRLRYRKTGSKAQKFWMVWHWLFMVGCVDFILFTMGRTALLTAAIMILLLGLLADHKYLKDKFGWLALRAVLFGLMTLAGLPVVYWTIRYIPAYCDHPLYWSGEWSEDKVQPRSSVDDPRYVDFDQALEAMFGRIVGPDGFIHLSGEEEQAEAVSALTLPGRGLRGVKLTALDDSGLGEPGSLSEMDLEDAFLEGEETDPGDYLWTFRAEMMMEGRGATQDYSGIYGFRLIPKPDNISARARLVVYKLYFSNLNLIGHRDYDSYFSTIYFQVYHGHNIFAQWMYLFGIPAGGLACLMLVWGLIRSGRLVSRKRPEAFVCLLFYVIHVGFGMLECVFFPGQAIIIFSLLMPFFLAESEKRSLWEEYLAE